MFESLPIFLLIGYAGTLSISLYTQKTFLREEIKYFCWYFVVGLLASILAHDSYISKGEPPEVGVDVNAVGMLRVLWYDFITPYVIAFLILNSVRLIILIVVRIRKKSQIS